MLAQLTKSDPRLLKKGSIQNRPMTNSFINVFSGKRNNIFSPVKNNKIRNYKRENILEIRVING